MILILAMSLLVLIFIFFCVGKICIQSGFKLSLNKDEIYAEEGRHNIRVGKFAYKMCGVLFCIVILILVYVPVALSKRELLETKVTEKVLTEGEKEKITQLGDFSYSKTKEKEEKLRVITKVYGIDEKKNKLSKIMLSYLEKQEEIEYVILLPE